MTSHSMAQGSWIAMAPEGDRSLTLRVCCEASEVSTITDKGTHLEPWGIAKRL